VTPERGNGGDDANLTEPKNEENSHSPLSWYK
jgi:hypothetical protein